MTKNAGIKNLGKLDLQKIGERASFTENKKDLEKTNKKKKGFPIYPHPDLLDLLRESKEKGKLPAASSYFVMAAMEKLVRDGFEKQLREKGLM